MDNYLRGVRGKDLHSYIRVSLCFGRNNLVLKDGKRGHGARADHAELSSVSNNNSEKGAFIRALTFLPVGVLKRRGACHRPLYL